MNSIDKRFARLKARMSVRRGLNELERRRLAEKGALQRDMPFLVTYPGRSRTLRRYSNQLCKGETIVGFTNGLSAEYYSSSEWPRQPIWLTKDGDRHWCVPRSNDYYDGPNTIIGFCYREIRKCGWCGDKGCFRCQYQGFENCYSKPTEYPYSRWVGLCENCGASGPSVKEEILAQFKTARCKHTEEEIDVAWVTSENNDAIDRDYTSSTKLCFSCRMTWSKYVRTMQACYKFVFKLEKFNQTSNTGGSNASAEIR